ncbi:MAG: hypothetical protein K9J80_16660, partial [Sulfuritalea sp.]|nr:hypothetical protein [Sulfuritalea sp.]
QLPANSLRRLHLAAGEGGGAAFCLRPLRLAAAGSPAPLRLQLQTAQTAGGRLRVTLLKRRGPPARQSILLDVARPASFSHDISHAVAGTVLPDASGRRRRVRVAA